MRSQQWLAVGAAVALNAAPALGRAADRTPFEQSRISYRQMQAAQAYDLSNEGSNGLEVSANAAVSVSDVLAAMDVDPAIIITPSIYGQNRQFGVFPGLGVLAPSMGANFAWFSSGVAGAGTPYSVDPSAFGTQSGTNVGGTCPSGTGFDCAFITFSFQVPTGMNSVQFDFNFMSVEYPEFVNLGFNDEFAVKLTSPTYNYANIVFDMNGAPVNIDSAFFNQPCSTLAGTGFEIYSFSNTCDAGATGLLHTEAPVKPGETVTLEFSIRDRGDGIYDSAVLLDNFFLSTEVVDGPSTGGEVQIDWISPKSGYVAGGTQVTLHGNGFENVQAVTIGGNPALYQVLDEFTIVAVTPPHPVGPVDVAVTAQPSSSVSTGVAVNAFTYFTHPEGAPLAVLSVDPPEGPADGNVKVTVRGAGFDLDSIVTFDGEAVGEQQFINGDEIIVTTPPGGGAVEVRVTNAGGETASLDDGYLYIGNGAGSGNGAGGCGCTLEENRSAPISLIFASLGLAIAAWLNRRRRKLAVLAAAGIALAGCNDTALAPVNSAPIADAGEQVEAFTGDTVTLDGSESHDFEDGSQIEFLWEIVSKPDGSVAELDDATSKTPTLIPDVSGLYRIGLTVTDTDMQTSGAIGYGGTADDNLVDVVALPFRDMRVTLTWDTDQSDLDLHLIRDAVGIPGIVTNYWDPYYDCYYGVPDPEWGTSGIRADNPLLEQDVDTGFGPEIISLASPQDSGKYDIVAHVYNSHGAGLTNGTLKLEMNGQIVAEVYSALPLGGTDSVWVIGSILWPEGTFTEVNMQTTHQTLGGPPH